MSPLRTIAGALGCLLCGGSLATVPAATEAAAQPRPSRDCFWARSVNGFTPVGREAVDVFVSRSRQYRLSLGGYCPDVDWSLRLALRTRGGSSFICAGGDAEIIVPGPIGRQRCLVTGVRRLTPAEIEARRATPR